MAVIYFFRMSPAPKKKKSRFFPLIFSIMPRTLRYCARYEDDIYNLYTTDGCFTKQTQIKRKRSKFRIS